VTPDTVKSQAATDEEKPNDGLFAGLFDLVEEKVTKPVKAK